MMKTLFVGDLHLQQALILSKVAKVVAQEKIERVIFTGDYVDAYGQKNNSKLFLSALDLLKKFKEEHLQKGIEVVNLVGNHDAPYMIDRRNHYTSEDPELILAVKKRLYDLGLQVAFQLDDYLVSHAGFNQDFEVEDWNFEMMTEEEHKSKLFEYQTHVGYIRRGRFPYGSPIWSDFMETTLHTNPKYPKQVVGHTPQKAIQLGNIIGIDTFSNNYISEQGWQLIGNGDLLCYEEGQFKVIPTDWSSEVTIKGLEKLFWPGE